MESKNELSKKNFPFVTLYLGVSLEEIESADYFFNDNSQILNYKWKIFIKDNREPEKNLSDWVG
jgi:hypothetical protein